MEKKIQNGTAIFPRRFWIYLGDVGALKSASEDEIWDVIDQRVLEHRSIEKDKRRKNLKKKKCDMANNISNIGILLSELRQRNKLRKQKRDYDALKLALQNAAARNALKRSIVRTGTVIPIGLQDQSR